LALLTPDEDQRRIAAAVRRDGHWMGERDEALGLN
jgi:hypothetical protein